MHVHSILRQLIPDVEMIWLYSIQSNLPIWSPLLSSHLYLKVTLFLSCHRKYYMNLTSFKRSHVLQDNFYLSQRWPLYTGLTVNSIQEVGKMGHNSNWTTPFRKLWGKKIYYNKPYIYLQSNFSSRPLFCAKDLY